ncbi:Chaperone protein DnaJ (plasmid) [Euzebya pacifica]|uniref:Chaperone protein DnaJ n=1 Tax=Euzebya pacifica TaxID=1608957 RepID=A0A346Y6D3_9ACTN|nr:DnaJ domain-containing protein [Euzebya pacifica]AXV10030.1 Chaperone protein DnaJ [Euzebya pacifica]
MHAATANLYEVLGVPQDADADTIKKAYRSAARTSHPDTGGDEETFKAIGEAYRVLSNPLLRREHDRALAHPLHDAPGPDPATGTDGWEDPHADQWDDVPTSDPQDAWDDVPVDDVWEDAWDDIGPSTGPDPQQTWSSGGNPCSIGNPGGSTVAQALLDRLPSTAFVFHHVIAGGLRSRVDHVVVHRDSILLVHDRTWPSGTHTLHGETAHLDGRRNRSSDPGRTIAADTALLADLPVDQQWTINSMIAVTPAGTGPMDLTGWHHPATTAVPIGLFADAVTAWAAERAAGPASPAVIDHLATRTRRSRTVTHDLPVAPRTPRKAFTGLGRTADRIIAAATTTGLAIATAAFALLWFIPLLTTSDPFAALPTGWQAAYAGLGLALAARVRRNPTAPTDTLPPVDIAHAAHPTSKRTDPTDWLISRSVMLAAAVPAVRWAAERFPFGLGPTATGPLLTSSRFAAALLTATTALLLARAILRPGTSAAAWAAVMSAPAHRWPMTLNALRWHAHTAPVHTAVSRLDTHPDSRATAAAIRSS